MWEEIVRIIHITDLHLFVNSHGTRRPAHEQAMIVLLAHGLATVMMKFGIPVPLLDGLDAHSNEALRALTATLQQKIRSKAGCPLILVQSGDVEAYGGIEIPNQPFPFLWQFPAFDYWQSLCNSLASTVHQIVNIFGNHDVWPRTLPLFRPFAAGHVEINLRKRPEFLSPLPERLDHPSGKFSLQFFRLNTVLSQFLQNTIAQGYLSADGQFQTGSSKFDAILGHIAALAPTPNPAKNIIRVLVMHHPPHFFGLTGLRSKLREGWLTNPNDLIPALNKQRFHLVIAGHRHALDPRQKTAPLPTSGNPSQPPLPSSTVQLVAGSATQFSSNAQNRPSFNLYSLSGNDQLGLLCVEREVYRYRSDLDSFFQPDLTETVVCQLPL